MYASFLNLPAAGIRAPCIWNFLLCRPLCRLFMSSSRVYPLPDELFFAINHQVRPLILKAKKPAECPKASGVPAMTKKIENSFSVRNHIAVT
jgi:hypothetical protein